MNERNLTCHIIIVNTWMSFLSYVSVVIIYTTVYFQALSLVLVVENLDLDGFNIAVLIANRPT